MAPTAPTEAYIHTNTRGQEYVLHGKRARLMNGHTQQIYYFARDARPHEALAAVPEGYRVQENERTGLPFLKKS